MSTTLKDKQYVLTNFLTKFYCYVTGVIVSCEFKSWDGTT